MCLTDDGMERLKNDSIEFIREQCIGEVNILDSEAFKIENLCNVIVTFRVSEEETVQYLKDFSEKDLYLDLTRLSKNLYSISFLYGKG